MAALVRHFGDLEGARPCGHCDYCAPDECLVHRFRDPDEHELALLARIMGALARRDGQSSGKLHRETFDGNELDRRGYERLLDGLIRAGLLFVTPEAFEKDGREIHWLRISRTDDGRRVGNELKGCVRLPEEEAPTTRKTRAAKAAAKAADIPAQPADPGLVKALKAWRLGVAKAAEMRAFRVMSNKVLEAIAAQKPSSEQALLEIKGVGPATVENYGQAILDLLAAHGG